MKNISIKTLKVNCLNKVSIKTLKQIYSIVKIFESFPLEIRNRTSMPAIILFTIVLLELLATTVKARGKRIRIRK